MRWFFASAKSGTMISLHCYLIKQKVQTEWERATHIQFITLWNLFSLLGCCSNKASEQSRKSIMSHFIPQTAEPVSLYTGERQYSSFVCRSVVCVLIGFRIHRDSLKTSSALPWTLLMFTVCISSHLTKHFVKSTIYRLALIAITRCMVPILQFSSYLISHAIEIRFPHDRVKAKCCLDET